MASSFRSSLCLGFVAIACSLPASAAYPARIGNYGFDSTGMDLSVRPGDDFNAYANGVWAKRTSIPGDHAYWGVWDILEEQARGQVREILEDAAKAHAPAGTNARKIGDFYATFIDEAAVETRGAAPLKQQLASIAKIGTYAALAKAMGQAIRVDDSMPVTVFVYADFKRPEVNTAYLDQGGLGLPDRDYYLNDDPAMAAARAAYLAYAAKLLQLSGVASTEAGAAVRAKAVLDLEHRLAKIQWTRVHLRDLPARYVPWTQADYRAKAPGFAWNAYFKAAGLRWEHQVGGAKADIRRVAPVAAAAIANESSRPNPAGGERQLSGLTAVGATASSPRAYWFKSSCCFRSDTLMASVSDDRHPR
jgi:putative endopeptidase